jgi:hypothetical protein
MIKLGISIGIGMSLVKSKCQGKVTVLVNYVLKYSSTL